MIHLYTLFGNCAKISRCNSLRMSCCISRNRSIEIENAKSGRMKSANSMEQRI